MKRFASLCEVAAAAASGATGGPSDGAWPGFTAGEITADFVNPARQMHGHAARVLCHFANFADRLAKYSAILKVYLTMTCNLPPSTLPHCHCLRGCFLSWPDPTPLARRHGAWRMQVIAAVGIRTARKGVLAKGARGPGTGDGTIRVLGSGERSYPLAFFAFASICRISSESICFVQSGGPECIGRPR